MKDICSLFKTRSISADNFILKETFMLLNEFPAILLKMLRTGGSNFAEYFEKYVTIKAKIELVMSKTKIKKTRNVFQLTKETLQFFIGTFDRLASQPGAVRIAIEWYKGDAMKVLMGKNNQNLLLAKIRGILAAHKALETTSAGSFHTWKVIMRRPKMMSKKVTFRPKPY